MPLTFGVAAVVALHSLVEIATLVAQPAAEPESALEEKLYLIIIGAAFVIFFGGALVAHGYWKLREKREKRSRRNKAT